MVFAYTISPATVLATATPTATIHFMHLENYNFKILK